MFRCIVLGLNAVTFVALGLQDMIKYRDWKLGLAGLMLAAVQICVFYKGSQ